MLSRATKQHFKLFDDPFSADPQGPEDVFLGPDQYDAIEALMDAVRAGRMFALVGESGSGKTTLVDYIKDKIVADHIPMRIVQPMLPDKAKLSGRAMLEALVLDLAPGTTLKNSSEKLARQAHELLANTTAAGTYNVLLFEEAHDLSLAALKELKRFNEFKTRWKKLLSIVLIGQPELLTKLSEEGAVAAREVARRLEHKTLMPLDSALPDYIGHRLARRGRKTEELFEPEALGALTARLQGTVKRDNGVERVSMIYPLLVNRLVIKALNDAAAIGATRVDAELVRGVK
jgi:type II secretory pathway predicted ATPase ExeA